MASHAQAASAAPLVLRRGNPAEPDTLDPHKSSVDDTITITGDMFLSLVQGDALDALRRFVTPTRLLRIEK